MDMKKKSFKDDADLMDELMEAMDGMEAEKMKPAPASAGTVVEICIKPSDQKSQPEEKEDEDEMSEDELSEMEKRYS